ncbi:hypothetical protein RB653_000821 [Dictyostelium firmibasis]|uniref:Leucine-rich repeat-containing protein n=1 Tax=Dictyostelium firmibasis TaxID=79012 RepID=A0AAN7U2X0_9MYCE
MVEEEILKKFLERARASSCENIINLDLDHSGTDFNKFVKFFPKLINLKCLILSNNNSNQLPPLEQLIRLEELYMRNFIITPVQINKAPLSTDSELTKSFIIKIKTLTNLKHLVITGTKFDTDSSKNYIVYYLNALETLNFEEITIEKRLEVNNRIKIIKEKQTINKNTISSKILTTPNKTSINRPPQDISTKKLENTTSSIVNASKSPTPLPLPPPQQKQQQLNYQQKQISSPKPFNSTTPIKQKEAVSPQKLNKVDFKLPPQILSSCSPKHQPKLFDLDVPSHLPMEIAPNLFDQNSTKFNDKSNLIQAVSLLIGSITTLTDIEFIEDILYERKKSLNEKKN